MPEDTRVPSRPWPPGPFLAFPDDLDRSRADFGEPAPLIVPPVPSSALGTPAAGAPEPASEADTQEDEENAEEPPARAPSRPVGKPRPEPEGDDGEAPAAPADGPEVIDSVEKTDAPVPVPPAEPALPATAWLLQLRQAGEGDEEARRRRRVLLAAKYGTGAAIGWGLGADDLASDALVYAHYDPGTAVCILTGFAGGCIAWNLLGRSQQIFQPSFSAIGQLFSGVGRIFGVIPGIGALVGSVSNIWNAVFTHYVPFRVMASAAGAYFAFPWGYVAVGYAQSKGLDTTSLAPHLVGIAATGTSWYAIDRRTQAYARHLPGHALHWATCAITGTAGLATGLYMTP